MQPIAKIPDRFGRHFDVKRLDHVRFSLSPGRLTPRMSRARSRFNARDLFVWQATHHASQNARRKRDSE
jgi:hypothetical protein